MKGLCDFIGSMLFISAISSNIRKFSVCFKNSFSECL